MPTRIQSTGKGRVQAGATATCTFGSLPAIGNLIIVMVEGYTQAGNAWDAGDVTDNQGHTYELAETRSYGNAQPNAAIYYTVVTTSSGTFTVTLNQTAGSDWMAGSAVEYEPDTVWDLAHCLNQSTGATGTGTAIATGSTAGSAAADEVAAAVCGIGANQASITVESVSPAWVEEHEELSWTQYVPGEGNTRVLTGSGTQSASWTAASSGNWAAVIATFREGTAPVSVSGGLTLGPVTLAASVETERTVSGAIALSPVTLDATVSVPVDYPAGTICDDDTELFDEDFESGDPLATLGAVDYSGATTNFGSENTTGEGLNGTTWGLLADAGGAGDYPEVGWNVSFGSTRFGWVEFWTDFSRLQEFGWTLVAATDGNYANGGTPVFDLYVGTDGTGNRKFWLYTGYAFPTAVAERTNAFTANSEQLVKVCFRQSTYTAGTPNADGEFYVWIDGVLVWALTNIILAPGGETAAIEITRIYANPPGRLDELRVGYGVDTPPETRTPPGGGGTTGAGTNPTAAVVPTGVLRLFFEMRVGGGGSPYTTVTGAETMLRDPDTWFGGKKPPRLLSVSEIEREFSADGSFRGAEIRVVLADTDRTFRTLAATSTLSGAYFALYVVSDTVRYALGEPYRLFAGKVSSHQALAGFRYELTVRDVLSDRIADLDASPRVPPDRLSIADFPGMEAEYEGRAVPLVIGYSSDEAEAGNIAQIPQGVIPPVILGTVNFTYWGGINMNVIACIWSQGALAANGVWSIYYNTPEAPDVRVEVPLAAYGVDVWTPGMYGWDDTGLATEYVDYPLPLSAATRRYTPFFVRAGHPLAQAFLEGRVLAAANLYGIAENGDGSGDYISDAPRVWQWLVVNQLFSPYTTGAYAAVPLLDETYSIIDTDTVEATVTRLRGFLGGGGDAYPVGFLLGRGGSQQTLRHVLGELCAGVLMEQGINRHGQLMVDVEDVDAVAAVQLSDLLDIEDGEFVVWVDHAAYRNRIEYVHGFRYVPPSAPPATPPEGEALPARPLPPYYDWTSGLQVLESSAAIAAFGARRSLLVENYVVRDATVAADVADRLLTRLAGPSPSYDGPRMFRLTTSWQGLGTAAAEIELGTVIGITHLEGLGASGYAGTRGRVTKIRIDPQRARVTLEGRILGEA